MGRPGRSSVPPRDRRLRYNTQRKLLFYTRIRRRLVLRSILVTSLSLRLGLRLRRTRSVLARPQPSRAAERVLPCSRVLPSTHSHVKILSTPLAPLLQGGTITYTLYLCHFQKKKRHNFGQKLINLEKFHISYTFPLALHRFGAAGVPVSSRLRRRRYLDVFLFATCIPATR